MLTALTIQNESPVKWYEKIISRIRGNSIKVEIKGARGVPLRHITYISRSGSVNWDALDSVIGAQRNHILCAEDVLLPADLGYKRFDNRAFKSRLAANLGVFVLSKLKNKMPELRVALYDPCADCPALLAELTRYNGNIVAVTDGVDEYNDAAERLAAETGASVRISRSRSALADCGLVIAPVQIREILPLSGNAVVLSSNAPTVCTPGLVYYRYHFRMPNMFDKIKPRELSEEYFAGALYTKARQYELGSIVPMACSNYASSQTYLSICRHLCPE